MGLCIFLYTILLTWDCLRCKYRYCVQNTLFVDKQQQNGDSTTSSYDQKLKMSKVSLTTLLFTGSVHANIKYNSYGLEIIHKVCVHICLVFIVFAI